MDPRYQVFISSTFKDLKHERQELTLSLLDRYIPVGMEGFPASPNRGWAVIQSAIDHSDYYVLLIGGLYGSRVPGDCISWTEREYSYAYAAGVPVLAFIREVHSISAEHQESDPGAADKLAKFKATVRERHLTQPWSDVNGLIRRVKDALDHEIRLPTAGPRPGWYRGKVEQAQANSSGERRAWSLHTALQIDLIPDDANAVIVEEDQTSVRLYLRLVNVSPCEIRPESLRLECHVTLDQAYVRSKEVIEVFEVLGPGQSQTIAIDVSLPKISDAIPSHSRLAAVGNVVATLDGDRSKRDLGSFTYGRVADNRRAVARGGLPAECQEYMLRLASAYKKAGLPQREAWTFARGAEDTLHKQLTNLYGLLERVGTRGGPYRLTTKGHAYVRRLIEADADL